MVALVAKTKDEALARIAEAIRAYSRNEDVNPISVLKLAEEHQIERGPIEEALELACASRGALSRPETQPEEVTQPLGLSRFGWDGCRLRNPNPSPNLRWWLNRQLERSRRDMRSPRPNGRSDVGARSGCPRVRRSWSG
jgi:hypothetical protein